MTVNELLAHLQRIAPSWGTAQVCMHVSAEDGQRALVTGYPIEIDCLDVRDMCGENCVALVSEECAEAERSPSPLMRETRKP